MMCGPGGFIEVVGMFEAYMDGLNSCEQPPRSRPSMCSTGLLWGGAFRVEKEYD